MDIKEMRKPIFLCASTLMVVATLVVSSFAWYKMSNGGNLNLPIDTTEGESIAFSFSSYKDVDGTLSPAKMKQGVLNNHFHKEDYTNGKYPEYEGSILSIPVDTKCLAKTNVIEDKGVPAFEQYELSYDEDLGIKKLIPQSQYLESPGSVVYRQFTLRMGSTSSEITKNVIFDIDVDYYDIFEHEDGESSKHSLTQKDALSFSFYVIDSNFSAGALSEISTVVDGDATNKKTISEMFYDPLQNGRYAKTEDRIVNSGKKYYKPVRTGNPDSVNPLAPEYHYYNQKADHYELCTSTDIEGKEFYIFEEVESPTTSQIGTYYEKVVNKLYKFDKVLDDDLSHSTVERANNSYYRLRASDEAETWVQANKDAYNVVPFDTSAKPEKCEKCGRDVGSEEYKCSYCGANQEEKFSMTVKFNNLEYNKTYYVLTCVYYKVPDELLDGNLWLANKVDINIDYRIETLEAQS